MSILGSVVSVLQGKSSDPRHEKRRHVRRLLAQAKLATEQRIAAQAEVKAEEAALEAATVEHGKITTPIQDALQRLEEERLEAAVNQAPLSPTWQTRYTAEQARLTAANIDLEKISTEFRQRLKVLNARLRATQQKEFEFLGTIAPNALQNLEYANPALVMQAQSAGQALKYAQMRAGEARKFQTRVEEHFSTLPKGANMGTADEYGTLAFQRESCRYELRAAQQAVADAQAEVNRIQKLIEDE